MVVRRSSEVQVDTDAGWKTLALVGRNGGRLTFRAAMGPPEDIRAEDARRRRRGDRRHDAADGQSAVRVDRPGSSRRGAIPSSWPGAGHASAVSAGTNVEFALVEGARPGTHPDLGARRGADDRLGHGRVRVGGRRDRTCRRRSRDVEVIAPGGSQRVEWRDDGVYLTGWAEVVFDGVWIPPADVPAASRDRTEPLSLEHGSCHRRICRSCAALEQAQILRPALRDAASAACGSATARARAASPRESPAVARPGRPSALSDRARSRPPGSAARASCRRLSAALTVASAGSVTLRRQMRDVRVAETIVSPE